MADMFSDEWMKGYQNAWNGEPELSGELQKIGFNSTIGYGFKGEGQPRGVIVVENGVATDAGAYAGQPLNWDLRADESTWSDWLRKPPGMMGLGMAYTSKKLQFAVGDYAAMIKDPRM
ncbi:MAG: hypothetical protein KDJ16_12100, partial [Hyphomicrobiales bacterium]|nr:hypothetical protein [Hyphomicrobiales bacterium]